MSLKLHAMPLSPRGFKAVLVANHLAIDYEFVLCDLGKGDQKQPRFTAMNPNQRMPVLEDGDFSLWESNAIIQYLAAKKPESGLLPKDERDRADVTRWQFWESTTFDPACATLVYENAVKRLFGIGEPDPVEVEKGLAKFNAAARILNGHLKGRDYVAQNRLTVADFSLGSALVATEMAHLPVDDYPEMKRWAAMLTALPAWNKTLAMAQPR